MKCRIFSEITGLIFEAGKSIGIVDDYVISQHEGNVLNSNLFDDFVRRQIGDIGTMNFVNRPYLWCIRDEENPNIAEINRIINTNMGGYLSFLWFIKDNSVSLLQTYCYAPEKDQGSNFFARRNQFTNSNCWGEAVPISFTLSDYETVLELYSKASPIIGVIDKNVPVISSPKQHGTNIEAPRFNLINYNETNRISRALNFLQLARTQSFLPIKISFYTAILECLFTTDNQEVSHKVAERTSYYLGANDKYDTYKIVKLSYDLRSKFFHGQRLDNKVSGRDKQKELSMVIDDIIRNVLTKIIMKDSEKFLDEDYLTAFMNSLVFGSNLPIEEYESKKGKKITSTSGTEK